MIILAIADQAPSISIKSLIEKNSVDLICALGDLDIFQLRELENITTIPKIGVYGNHCSGNYFDDLGIKNMHLTTFEFGGLVFGGFEGCVRYKDSKYAKMYTQAESEAMLKDFPVVDVMIAHCPPFGINDDQSEVAHTGFKGLKMYVDEKKPKYLLHGHTYPKANELITKYADTNIIYVAGEKFVTLDFKA